jgi:hypothetical protein
VRFDPQNTNQGTEVGRSVVKMSIRDLGIGRPVFAAADGTLMGGNHAMKSIDELGADGVTFGEPIFVRLTCPPRSGGTCGGG